MSDLNREILSLTDLREVPNHQFSKVIMGLESDGLVISASQHVEIASLLKPSKNIFAVVPDFLHYGRLIKTGNGLEILRKGANKLRALKAIWKAAREMIFSPLRVARQDFWVASRALLSYDLALLGKSFTGTLILHPYLSDLAFSLMQKRFMEIFFKKNKNFHQKGIWTFQVTLAISLLMQWNQKPDFIIYHIPSNDLHSLAAIHSAQTSSFFQNVFFLPDSLITSLTQRRNNDSL